MYIYIYIFEFKTHKDFETTSSLYVPNCFQYFVMYILEQNVLKIRQEKFGTISSLCVTKCSNTSILYNIDGLKSLLSKNWFYFFFIVF